MIIINLDEMPPSVNHYWVQGKNNIRFISARGRNFKRNLQYAAKTIEDADRYFDKKISLDITVYTPDRRRRDIDNFLKAIMDSLNGIIYKDDSQVFSLVVTKKLMQGIRGTNIRIKEFQETDG